MRQRVHDIPDLLRTPIGRVQLRRLVYRSAWPLARRLASVYRSTLVRRTHVVAVVGSFGKSTTARAVSMALGQQPRPRLEFNAFSYVAESILLIRPGDRQAIIEVGIGGRGQMSGYARMLRPDVAVVTSIGSEHNRSLGTLEVTRHEKAEMVRALSPAGLAVLNGDDPHVRWMAGQTRARVVTCGLGEDNDVRASDVRLDWPSGTQLTLHAGGESRRISTRLLGRHLVYPILAAVTVALNEGLGLDDILPRLTALPPTPGRLEVVALPNGAYLLRDDYKSSLETIDAALDVLAEIPARRRVVVLGEVSEPPGSQGPIYRRLGERVSQIATRAIFVGGNFQRYAAGATRGGLRRADLIDAGTSVQAAAEAVQADLAAGDVVLIKGRDTQRLDRVALALAGRRVRCELTFCDVRVMRCERCPMLERGWAGQRVVSDG